MSTDAIPDSVRALIGKQRRRQHLVTEHEVVRFAQAVGESVTRVGDRVQAPLLFCQALTYEEAPVEELPEDGSPLELHVPLPAVRTVGGGSEYLIHRRVHAGEVVTIESTLKDVYRKQGRGGELFMVVVETRFTDAEDQPIAQERATYIKRA